MSQLSRVKKQGEIIERFYDLDDPTEAERDIYHLTYMRYGIGEYSYYYRHGYIRTLDRAIRAIRENATRHGEAVRL